MPWPRLALLTRHFFRRFLDNDVISPNGDAHVGLSQTLAAFLAPGFLVAAMVLFRYALVQPTWTRLLDLLVSDSLLYVSLSMITLGMAATITWDAFYLDARDRYILAALPVPGWLLTAAKLAALGLFLAVFVGAMNLVPVVLLPGIMLQSVDAATWFRQFVPLTLAQAIAPSLAGAWTVLAVVALRGLLALVVPRRAFQRASLLAQGVLVLGFLAWTMSLSPFLDASDGILSKGGWLRDASPPMWFLGLYQAIVGNPQPYYLPLALTALAACAGSVLLVLALFFGPSGRGAGAATAYVSDSPGSLASAMRAVAARLLVRHPLGRACFTFTLVTLGRSGKHRLYLAAALGAGLAWAATGVFWQYAQQGWEGLRTPTTTLLQVQPILVLLLVGAMRFGVLVPATLPANWLFKVTERRPIARYCAGTRRAVFLLALLPAAALFPFHLALWDAPRAAYHALVGVLYTAFLVAAFFNNLAKIPFAATYVSGSLRLRSRIGQYLIGALVLTTAPSALESFVFRGLLDPISLPVGLAVLTLIASVTRWQRERRLQGLVFDDPLDDDLQTLRLVE